MTAIHTTDIQLFQILKQKLGEKEAEALVGFVDARLREHDENNLARLREHAEKTLAVMATKEDLAKTEGRLQLLIGDTKTLVASTKSEMIKWMFIFWTGTIGALVAIVKFFHV